MGHVQLHIRTMTRFIWLETIKGRLTAVNKDLKHRQRNGRQRRFAAEVDWAKGFVFGGENEV